MSSRINKKLARVVSRLLDNNLSLARQADGSFMARQDGKVYARLNANEAQQACSHGVLDVNTDHSLCINAQSRTWLERYQSITPDSAFANQHRVVQRVSFIDTDGYFFKANKNMAESPLYWLRTHKGPNGTAFLSAAEFAAGERFRDDYAYSSLSQKMCANWDMPALTKTTSGPRNAVLDAADNAIAAKDRVMKALAALGPGLDDLVFSLCIRESSLDAVERARQWPKRTAKVVLKLALDRLARHYGLIR